MIDLQPLSDKRTSTRGEKPQGTFTRLLGKLNYIATGEFRPPKKGEWFLGFTTLDKDTPMVWQAEQDTLTFRAFWIARREKKPSNRKEYFKQRRADRIADNKCVECGDREPSGGTQKCEQCRAKSNPRALACMNAKNRNRKACGRCIRCGKARAPDSKSYCAKHRDEAREASRARYRTEHGIPLNRPLMGRG